MAIGLPVTSLARSRLTSSPKWVKLVVLNLRMHKVSVRRHDRDSINGIKPRIASGELLEDAKMAAIAAIVVICYNAEEVQTHIARRTV